LKPPEETVGPKQPYSRTGKDAEVSHASSIAPSLPGTCAIVHADELKVFTEIMVAAIHEAALVLISKRRA